MLAYSALMNYQKKIVGDQLFNISSSVFMVHFETGLRIEVQIASTANS